ncbi:hypothetical protein JHK86_022579 [Glycine max]|nr:hypothetical protein JHK86_022579 [Glycine max]
MQGGPTKREELEPEKRHANRGRILAFQSQSRKIQKLSLFLTLLFPSPPFSIETPTKLQPLAIISAPNRERRAFLES